MLNILEDTFYHRPNIVFSVNKLTDISTPKSINYSFAQADSLPQAAGNCLPFSTEGKFQSAKLFNLISTMTDGYCFFPWCCFDQ